MYISKYTQYYQRMSIVVPKAGRFEVLCQETCSFRWTNLSVLPTVFFKSCIIKCWDSLKEPPQKTISTFFIFVCISRESNWSQQIQTRNHTTGLTLSAHEIIQFRYRFNTQSSILKIFKRTTRKDNLHVPHFGLYPS